MAKSPKLNVDRLEAIYTWAEKNPHEWNQGSWAWKSSCGTTMCAAGTAVVQAGYKLLFSPFGAGADSCKKPRGKEWYIPDLAEKLLGLTYDERYKLFFETGTSLEELREAIDLIKDGVYR